MEGVDVVGRPEIALEPSVLRLIRLSRIEWVKMIAQVQMLASSRPSITALTTASACRNRLSGDIRSAEAVNGRH